jgi:hypothetical protein
MFQVVRTKFGVVRGGVTHTRDDTITDAWVRGVNLYMVQSGDVTVANCGRALAGESRRGHCMTKTSLWSGVRLCEASQRPTASLNGIPVRARHCGRLWGGLFRWSTLPDDEMVEQH